MDQQTGFPSAPEPLYPYDGPPVVYKRPRRRRPLVITLAAVLLAAVITVAAVLTLNPPFQLHGNAGVVAAFEYARSYMAQNERFTGATSGAVFKRLAAEPFEIECALNIKSSQFENSGIPLSSIPIGLKVKYDMTDLGVKMSVMGLQALSAFVIGDDFVVNVAGKAGSTEIKIPVEADLSEPMSLPARGAAFLPFLSAEHSGMYVKLLEAFAQSVPDDYTSTYTLNIYSPAADTKVRTQVVETVLDSAAVAEVIRNFIDSIQDDEALTADLQAIIDEVAKAFSVDSIVLSERLDALRKLDKSELGGLGITWGVYKRGGRYTGMTLTVTQNDNHTTTLLSEFDNNVFYFSTKNEESGNHSEAYTVNTYVENHMDIESKNIIDSKFISGTLTETGSVGYTRVGPNEYAADMDLTIDQAYTYRLSEDESNETQTNMELTGDLTFRFGDNLKTLRESSGWDDIYKKEWGSLEDAMQGLQDLGSMLGGALNLA